MGQSLGPWAHTTNVALSLSTTFLICITLLFGTETPGPRCQKEISLNQISIASKIWITWMMLMNWRLNFGLAGITMLIGLPRRILSILVSFLLFKMSIFTSVGNIFVWTQAMSKHRKEALGHQYDWNFHNIIGYVLCLDGSVMDNSASGKLTVVATYSWR